MSALQKCPYCCGQGWTEERDWLDSAPYQKLCDVCEGEGMIPNFKDLYEEMLRQDKIKKKRIAELEAKLEDIQGALYKSTNP